MPEPSVPHTIISRQEAKAKNLVNYFSGVPCVRGHIALRNVKQALCNSCRNENLKSWGEKNKQRLRQYRHKDSARRKSRLRAWKLVNRQRHRDLNRLSRVRNPEIAALRAKRYAQINPHIARVSDQNRRARERQAPGKFSKRDIETIFKRQGGVCVACRHSLRHGYHVDHITPLKLGGSNWPRNLQLLCPPCNLSKHARDPIEFMQSRGFLL